MTATPPSPTARSWPALIALCLLFHGPALWGGFVYDDGWTILSNPAVRDPSNLLRLLGPELARADVPDAGRPTMLATVILDWWLWGRAPFGAHLQNLLWHVAVTLLLYAGLRRLTDRAGLALAAAAIHAVHPLHVEVVAAINYREDLLATCFLLLALAAIERARQRQGGPAALARVLGFCAAAVSCFAKESGYLAIILLVMLDVGRRRGAGWGGLRRGLVDHLLLGLAALAAFAWRWWVFGAPGIVSRTAELPSDRFERWSTMLQACRVYVSGLGQYLLPLRLSPEYAPTAPGALTTALALAAMTFLLLAGALAVRVVVGRRTGTALLSLGFLWALAAYLPHLGLVPLTNLRADRYFYLPGLGLALLVAAGGDRLLTGRRLAGLALPTLLASLAVLLLGARTWRQGRIWRDDGALFQAAVQAAPAAPRAWRGLATAALHAGRTLDALAAVDQALRLSDDAHARELRGLILMRQGALAPARAELLRALALAGSGHRPRVLNNLGYVELELGETGLALERFAEARRLAPAFDRPWLNAARAHGERGEQARARALLTDLVAAIPESIDGWVQLGALHQREGRQDEARRAYARALTLSRGDPNITRQLQRLERSPPEAPPSAAP